MVISNNIGDHLLRDLLISLKLSMIHMLLGMDYVIAEIARLSFLKYIPLNFSLNQILEKYPKLNKKVAEKVKVYLGKIIEDKHLRI